MTKKNGILLGLIGLGAMALVAVWPTGGAQGYLMPDATWTATPDYLNCDQRSAATECAEWQTPEGSMLLVCCVPPEALGTTDPSWCKDGGIARDGRGGL